MSTEDRARSLPFRQVHLDFHTHGGIPNVGGSFDKKEFQEALRMGRVNSVTLFAKCHHGWSYHDTQVGKKHPTLEGELLPRQIEACREIGVRYRVYVSAGWDELVAAGHPEWQVKDRGGVTHLPFHRPGYQPLRFNSPYLDYLCAQIEEVARRWPDADGFFLDIIKPWEDFSEDSLRAMLERGLDPENEDDVREYSLAVLDRYYERSTAAARAGRADMQVFHNSGHMTPGNRNPLVFNSHLEIESLPTGGWGYDHFPLAAAYAATTGHEYLGMTAKFHTMWGEFGGFKRAAALRYECALMLANGAKCSVGDQLHPSGVLDPQTYRLIGEAFAEVEEREPWCEGARPLARIGILSTSSHERVPRSHTDPCYPDEGAARMLLEAHLPFVVLDRKTSWDGLDLVILPDELALDAGLIERVEHFMANGGKILASGTSLFNADRSRFVLDFGAVLRGRSLFDPDYLIATELSAEVHVRSPIVIHGGAWEIEAPKCRVLAERSLPYFNRTWREFCSHQHTPEAERSKYPGAVIGKDGNLVWFAHAIFSRYRLYGQPLYRDFVVAAVRRLLGDRLPVETNLPSAGRVFVTEQPEQHRYLLHLLYATPSLRGNPTGPSARAIEVIEELPALHDVSCRLRLPKTPVSARLVPGDEELPLVREAGAATINVPNLQGHQIVALDWG